MESVQSYPILSEMFDETEQMKDLEKSIHEFRLVLKNLG